MITDYPCWQAMQGLIYWKEFTRVLQCRKSTSEVQVQKGQKNKMAKRRINRKAKKAYRKLRFANRWYFAVWAVLAIITFLLTYASSMRCWDGLKVDEEGLMEECGVTFDEFNQEIEANESFCAGGW